MPRLFVTLLMMGWLSPSLTVGAQVKVEFEATVETVDDAFCQCISHLIQVGDTIRGEFIYETSTQDANPDPGRGTYHHTTSPAGIFAEINGLLYETDPANVDLYVTIDNDLVDTGGLHDQFLIQSNKNLQVIGLDVERTFVLLRDNSATALSSDALGQTLPGLEKWPTTHRVDLFGPAFDYRIVGTLILLNVVEPPVPIEDTTWGQIKDAYDR